MPSLVTGLDGQDGAGDGDVGRVRDGVGGTEVSGDTDVLDEVGEGDERGNVGVRELVLARLDGSVSKSASKEGDVGLLVLGDLGKTSSDPVLVTGSAEVILGELSKSVGAGVSGCGGNGSRD